jgi:twinkle protein
MLDNNESNYLFKGSCDECGSSDAKAVYSDGHTYCFSCDSYGRPEGSESLTPKQKPKGELLPVGEFRALGKRRLTEDTCKKFGYSIGEDKSGNTVQIASHKKDGKIIAQKLRYPNKDFKFLVADDSYGLWGEHLWKPGGKMLVITEGEIDAMTVSQLQGNKWPVVSLPSGADKKGKSAAKAISKSIDFVNSFDKVVLMFDMDEPGQVSAIEAAKVLQPGKAFIANLGDFKDPNEAHVAGQGKVVIEAMWNAQPYRPDGIVNAADLWDRVKKPKENNCVLYPWEDLNKKTLGARKGELVVLTAGSGVGKSAVVREIAYHFLNEGQTIGMLMLEENIERTALGFMGLNLNHPLHLDRGDFTEERLHEAFTATAGSGRLWLYDHFGSTSAGNLLERVRYLATGCGCDFVVLDHISIAVSDAEANADANLDERKLIDMLMTKLRSLVEELGIGLFVISHLRRPSGDRGHEEGALTSLSQLRGSHAIAQLSDFVIGLERNQQDEECRNMTTLRVLKNRFSGDTGEAGVLYYNPDTGRLSDHTLTPAETTGGSDDY